MTPFITSNQHHTLYNRTSIDQCFIRNDAQFSDAGDVIAVGVAVAAGDGLAAPGDGRPTPRQNN
jgi:hypothetical protein